VNRQIVHLFGLALVLFAVLAVATTWWTVLGADGLEENEFNRRPLIEEQRVPRGLLLARDGTRLADNVAHGRGDSRTYTRTYPNGSLFGHAIGYSFIERGRAGLERYRNDELTGKENEFSSVISELQGDSREGRDVVTTLDARGQRAAIEALGGRRGSVVAIEPGTGRVRVMVSVPSFDPNQIRSRFGELNRAPFSPLLNRATQARYPPGSTFKVVTAAAALESGRFTPESVVDGSSPKTISGAPLANSGGQSFGPISLTDALTNSVNTVWAQVAERLGRRALIERMELFGFNQDPDLDFPESEMTASGIRDARGRLLDGDAGFDAGRVAIGQGGAEGQIQVTPLQMAAVAAAVGNDGLLMRPRLTERVVGKDGRVKERIEPARQARAMSTRTAEQLAGMMGRVVEEGTGTAAALSGIQVAGKTGTAEVDNATANQAWFIGFAPVREARMAVAVTIERTQGQGGTEAAPIAKRVLEVLLGEGA
jgi:peptidoglycan glycosyltransferase